MKSWNYKKTEIDEAGLKTTVSITTQNENVIRKLLGELNEASNPKKDYMNAEVKDVKKKKQKLTLVTPKKKEPTKSNVTLKILGVSKKQLESEILESCDKYLDYGKCNKALHYKISNYFREKIPYNDPKTGWDKIPVENPKGTDIYIYSFSSEQLKLLNRSENFRRYIALNNQYNSKIKKYFDKYIKKYRQYINIFGQLEAEKNIDPIIERRYRE